MTSYPCLPPLSFTQRHQRAKLAETSLQPGGPEGTLRTGEWHWLRCRTVSLVRNRPDHSPVKETSAGPRNKVPSLHLLLLASATGIGGTFQYGFNISVMNAPTWEKSSTCQQFPGFAGGDHHGSESTTPFIRAHHFGTILHWHQLW
uniref:Uncharacterized protein n=1 Tax=Eptatretus burgeri TaxID=7764 RepID=A0A8C4X074_EPTBU